METKDSYQQGLTRLEADVASLQKMKDRPSKNEVAIDILDRVLGVARGENNLLHNYRYREEAIQIEYDKYRQHINHKIHGADGVPLPGVEIKTGEESKAFLSALTPCGMFDKCQTRVEAEKELDAEILVKELQTGAIGCDGKVRDFLKEGQFKFDGIKFDSERRIGRLITLLEGDGHLKGGKLAFNQNRPKVKWPATLRKNSLVPPGVESLVFGVFFAGTARPVLLIEYNLQEAEEALGDKFEQAYNKYQMKMQNRIGKSASARDSVEVRLGDLLKGGSTAGKVFFVNFQKLGRAQERGINSDLAKIMSPRSTKEIAERLADGDGTYEKGSEEGVNRRSKRGHEPN